MAFLSVAPYYSMVRSGRWDKVSRVVTCCIVGMIDGHGRQGRGVVEAAARMRCRAYYLDQRSVPSDRLYIYG